MNRKTKYIYAKDKKTAFIKYINEYSKIDIPNHLKPYINYSSLRIDLEFNGMIIERVDDGKYLIIE